ncbi:hypothetical protein ACHAQH_005256 [Verticillium albo-atrum]
MADHPIAAGDGNQHENDDDDDQHFSFRAVRAAVDEIFTGLRERKRKRAERHGERNGDIDIEMNNFNANNIARVQPGQQPASLPAPQLPPSIPGLSLPPFANDAAVEPTWLDLWAANNEAWKRSRDLCRLPDEIVEKIAEYFVILQPSVKYVTIRGVYQCNCQLGFRQLKTWTGDGQPPFGEHCWCHITQLNLFTLGSTLRRDMRLPEDDIVRAVPVGVPPSYVIEQVSSQKASRNRGSVEKPLFGQAWKGEIRENEDNEDNFFRVTRDKNERTDRVRVDITRPGDNVGLYKDSDLFMIKYPYVDPGFPWLHYPFLVWQLDSSFHHIKRAAMDLTEFRKLAFSSDIKNLFRNMDRNQRWQFFHAQGMSANPPHPMGGPASVMFQLDARNQPNLRTMQAQPVEDLPNEEIDVPILNFRQGLDPTRSMCLTPPINYWSWALSQQEMDENANIAENQLMAFQQDLSVRDIDIDTIPDPVWALIEERINLHLEQFSIETLEENRDMYRPWYANRPNGATRFLADVLTGCDDFFLVTPMNWPATTTFSDVARYLKSKLASGWCPDCMSQHKAYPQLFNATRDMDYVEVRPCSDLWDEDERMALRREHRSILDAWPAVTHTLEAFRPPPTIRFLTLLPRDSRIWPKLWNMPHEDGGHELGPIGKYTPGKKRAFRDTYIDDDSEEEEAEPDPNSVENPVDPDNVSGPGGFGRIRKKVKTKAAAGREVTKEFLRSMETDFENALETVRSQGRRLGILRRPLEGGDADGAAPARQQWNQQDDAGAVEAGNPVPPPQLPVFPAGPPRRLRRPYAPIEPIPLVRRMGNPATSILELDAGMAFTLGNHIQAHVYAQIAALGYKVPGGEDPHPLPPGPANQYVAGGHTAHTVLVRQDWAPSPQEVLSLGNRRKRYLLTPAMRAVFANEYSLPQFRQYVWEILTQENDMLLQMGYPPYHTHWPYPEPSPGPWPFSRNVTLLEERSLVLRRPPVPWPPEENPLGPPQDPPPPPAPPQPPALLPPLPQPPAPLPQPPPGQPPAYYNQQQPPPPPPPPPPGGGGPGGGGGGGDGGGGGGQDPPPDSDHGDDSDSGGDEGSFHGSWNQSDDGSGIEEGEGSDSDHGGGGGDDDEGDEGDDGGGEGIYNPGGNDGPDPGEWLGGPAAGGHGPLGYAQGGYDYGGEGDGDGGDGWDEDDDGVIYGPMAGAQGGGGPFGGPPGGDGWDEEDDDVVYGPMPGAHGGGGPFGGPPGGDGWDEDEDDVAYGPMAGAQGGGGLFGGPPGGGWHGYGDGVAYGPPAGAQGGGGLFGGPPGGGPSGHGTAPVDHRAEARNTAETLNAQRRPGTGRYVLCNSIDGYPLAFEPYQGDGGEEGDNYPPETAGYGM